MFSYMFRPTHLYYRHVKLYLNSTLANLQQRMRPPHRVTIRCLNPLSDSLSFSTSDIIEERRTQHHVRKEAVPPLCEALLDSRHEEEKSELQKNTMGLHDALYTYEARKRLLSIDWNFSTQEMNCSDRPSAIGFNAINARFHKLGLDLSLENIFYGMQSMLNDPAALKQYLGMIRLPKAAESSAVQLFGRWFAYIAPRLLKIEEKRFLTRKQCIYDQQWFNVITGLLDNESIQNNAPREQSLYNLGPGLDLKHWKGYIDAVHRILGPQTAYLEIRRFKSQYPGQGGLGEGSTFFNDWFLDPSVFCLTQGDDPKLAWEIVQELEDPSKVLQPQTWSALLAYPDFNRIWIPRMFPWLDVPKLELPEERMMEASALRQLECSLIQLEEDMGLAWTGGEAGYHTIASKVRFLLNLEGAGHKIFLRPV
ncbi:hypothetical protein N7G274_001423 [Stereocaulon virgatum]|uniref:Uncharacterized protein n=1 Tax=Stereocaulon virgatum TaxID=373712 RepID=A0ABR4ARG3_9LECA